MVKVEIEKVSNGWLVTIERNGERVSRRFTLESALAKEIAFTAIETELDA